MLTARLAWSPPLFWLSERGGSLFTRGAAAAARLLKPPTHPKIKLLGFRVVYPPPPYQGGGRCQEHRFQDFLALVPEVARMMSGSIDFDAFWHCLQKSTKRSPAQQAGMDHRTLVAPLFGYQGSGLLYIDRTPQLGGDRTLQSTALGEYRFARSSMPGASKGSSFALVCANDV